MDREEKPSTQVHETSGRFTDGANQPQNITAVRAPVREAATKPARDLRGANGRPKKLRGSALVFLPQRRPNVEALVSAQESLFKVLVVDTSKSTKEQLHKNGHHRDVQGEEN